MARLIDAGAVPAIGTRVRVRVYLNCAIGGGTRAREESMQRVIFTHDQACAISHLFAVM